MQNPNETEEFSYDTVPYPSLTFPQTHPDHLATIAKLRGMNPASSEKCRVLELGCSDGTNLNWLADSLPESEFVGVDLAETHIIDAKKNATDLDLHNVTFFQQDVMEMTAETFGKFDYIIAHGLFSWVPDFVREKTLSLYRNLLTPNGVGYISYNVFPGFYVRQMVRDMMRYHTRNIENPIEKVQRGVPLVGFLAKHTGKFPIFHETLKAEFTELAGRSLTNVYHDDLSDTNQPFYFTEFIAQAEKHDLKFLSETEYFSTQTRGIPDEALKLFMNVSQNVVEYEQYLDFFDCRRFRQTLICHKDASLDNSMNLAKIKDCYVSSVLQSTAETPNLQPEQPEQFVGRESANASIDHQLTKAVLVYMESIGSHPIGFDELIEKAIELLQTHGFDCHGIEKEIEFTAFSLFQIYTLDSVRFHLNKPKVIDSVSEKPLASKFARWQLTKGRRVTNFIGSNLNFADDLACSLLALLDGTRTREDLLGELANFDENNVDLPELLDQHLSQFATDGLLIA